MSELQQQAVWMISTLSDDNVSFLLEIIRRIMPQEPCAAISAEEKEEAGINAFRRLDAARTEIRQYLPKNFDTEKKLEEARVFYSKRL